MTRVLDRGGAAQRRRAGHRHRAADVEAVRRRHAAVQRRRLARRLRRAGLAAVPPGVPQPGRQGDARRRRRSSTRPASFLSNTNLQHYSGEVHLSYGSQLFVICWNQFVSPGDRPGGAAGDHPRPARRQAAGQLLPRPVAVGRLPVPAAEPDRRRAADGRRHADDARPGAAKVDRRWRAARTDRSPAARWRRSSPSSNSAPTAAASSGPTPPTRSRTRPRWTNVVECVSILLIPMATAGHVRPDDPQPAARRRHLRRDAAHARRH